MAPISPEMASLKRSHEAVGEETSFQVVKKQKRAYRHHHSLHTKFDSLSETEPTIPNENAVIQSLLQSIAVIAKDAGFDEADPAAIQHLWSAAENYMTRITSDIRKSMTLGRRTKPIGPDFERAFRAQGTRLDSFASYLDKAETKIAPLPSFPISSPDIPTNPDVSYLGKELSGAEFQRKHNINHIPEGFPAFPSLHTFQETPVYPEREKDPRKVRELATAEGRKGEEALRRMVGSVKADKKKPSPIRNKIRARRNPTMDDMFEKAAKALLRMPPGKKNKTRESDVSSHTIGFDELPNGTGAADKGEDGEKTPRKYEMGPIVNSEMRFWRKDAQSSLHLAGRRTITLDD